MSVSIITGDALAVLRSMPAESVHMCCTSPPYFGLRDYGIEPQVWHAFNGNPELAHPKCENGHEWGGEGKSAQRLRNGIGGTLHGAWSVNDGMGETLNPLTGAFCLRCNAWRGDLGLEPTPALYIEHLVAVFAAVRRVLRKDGTLWVVVGDSYAGSWGAQSRRETPATLSRNQINSHPKRAPHTGSIRAEGLKPKDLIGIPWMMAFALRNDGWWLRQDNIWAKPSPMPESVQDRTTRSHEYVFMFAKSERYWYDGEAIKELAISDRPTGNVNGFVGSQGGSERVGPQSGGPGSSQPWRDIGGSRNKRSVWTVATVPSSVPHFATMPPALVEPCILAGTSARGVCSECGAPWKRLLKFTGERRLSPDIYGRPRIPVTQDTRKTDGDFRTARSQAQGDPIGFATKVHETVGWHATCSCDAGYAVPATILDPFIGVGTTAIVADRLGRNCIGIELSPKYAALAERRARSPGFPLEPPEMAAE